MDKIVIILDFLGLMIVIISSINVHESFTNINVLFTEQSWVPFRIHIWIIFVFCLFLWKKFVKTKIPKTYQDANLHLVVSFLSVLIKYLQVFYQPSDDSDSVNTWKNCYYADWFHVKNVGYGILHRYLQSTWYVVWCKKNWTSTR